MHRHPGQGPYTRLVAEKLRPNEFPRSAGLVTVESADLVPDGWRHLGFQPWAAIVWLSQGSASLPFRYEHAPILACDEASLELGYVLEQFVAFVQEWVELMRIDGGRNVGFTRLVARRSGRG